MRTLRPLLACLLLLSPSWAAAPAQQPADEPPSAQDVQARIASLEAGQAENKDELLATYRKVLDELELARQSALRAADFQRQTQEAPALLTAVRAELAQLVESGDPAEVPTRLDDLQSALDQAEANRQAAAKLVDDLTAETGVRAERLSKIPDELAAASQKVAVLRESLGAAVVGDPQADARRALLFAQVATLDREVEALGAERTAYETRRELLPLRLQRAKRRATRAQELATFWQARVSEQRKADAETAARDAERQRREITTKFPELSALAKRNEELASLRSGQRGVPVQIDEAKAALEKLRRLLTQVSDRAEGTRRKLQVAGLTQAMGSLLRREREWLPSPARQRSESAERKADLSAAQLLLIDIEENEYADDGETSELDTLLAKLSAGGPLDSAGPLASLARELVTTKDSLRAKLTAELGTLIDTLLEQERVHASLAEAVVAYRTYIEERILWVRSTTGSVVPEPATLAAALQWLASPSEWEQALRATAGMSGAGYRSCAPAVLLLMLALGLRRRVRRFAARSVDLVRSYRTDSYRHTLRVLLGALLLASPGPLLLYLADSLLTAPAGQSSVAMAVGKAAGDLVLTYLALAFLRQVAKEKRLGEAHFRWSAQSMRGLRRELRWFTPLCLSLLFVANVFQEQPKVEWDESIGRLAFAASQLTTAVFLLRLFRRKAAVLPERFEGGIGLLQRTRTLWFVLTVGTPFALSVLSALGYYYTAQQLGGRFGASLAVALGVVIVDALLLRWLFITRRKLAVEQARQRVLARHEKQKSEGTVSESGAPVVDEDAVDIPAMDAQTRQIFRTGVTVAALFAFFLIWSGAFPALRALDRVRLWPHLEVVSAEEPASVTAVRVPSAPAGAASDGATTTPMSSPGLASSTSFETASDATSADASAAAPTIVTLADIGLALVILVLMALAARNIPGLLEFSLLQRLPLDSGERFTVTTLTRYLILVIGTSAAFGAIGIGWERIQWLAAALTFGLAFGLQEIFANFVSGIIILIERPVRVGDIVTVDGMEGRVTRLHMRATTIQDWDRRELLVPNKQFITSNVVNWTLSDPITRLKIPVGIAYGSDTKRARELLLQVARASSNVLDEPAPQAIFRNFGESSLDFELRVFMKNRDLWGALVDELHTKIDAAFREAGIEISFPQRDLHVRSAEGLRGLSAQGGRPVDPVGPGSPAPPA